MPKFKVEKFIIKKVHNGYQIEIEGREDAASYTEYRTLVALNLDGVRDIIKEYLG